MWWNVLELSKRTGQTALTRLTITYCYWTVTMCLNVILSSVTYFKKSSREGSLHFTTFEGKIIHNILHLNLKPLASVTYAAFHLKSDVGYSYLMSPTSKHEGVHLPKVWKMMYEKIKWQCYRLLSRSWLSTKKSLAAILEDKWCSTVLAFVLQVDDYHLRGSFICRCLLNMFYHH